MGRSKRLIRAVVLLGFVSILGAATASADLRFCLTEVDCVARDGTLDGNDAYCPPHDSQGHPQQWCIVPD